MTASAHTGDMRTMISLQEATDIVLQATLPLGMVKLPLLEAVGLAAAAGVRSPIPSPPFANSAMDGYALRSQDLAAGCTRFSIVGEVPAGRTFEQQLQYGQAVRILTGAAVPASADTVVPQEDVLRLSESEVRLVEGPMPGAHVRPAGEDFPVGTEVVRAGQPIDAAAVGLLANIGYSAVAVHRRPQVAILATGDELLDIDEPLVPGKIHDSNNYSLAAAARLVGALPHLAGRVPDRVEALVDALKRLPGDTDLVVTSGGVSVGDYDLLAPSLQQVGFCPLFHKVAVKPGKPVLFGLLGSKPVFGLSGNPAASLVLFEMLVRPALRKMMGFSELFRPQVSAVLTQTLRKGDKRLHLVRARACRREGRWQVEPLEGQGSANLLTLARANALAVHPAEIPELAAGATIHVYLIRQPEDSDWKQAQG